MLAYPSSSGNVGSYSLRRPSTSYASEHDNPDEPADLVLALQWTLVGCEWLLAEWAKLKAVLDEGQAWISPDKLKAVRLLAKQPFDVIDTRDVAIVFLASFVLKGDTGHWYWEIIVEMNDADAKRFRNSAATRQLNSLKPADAGKARQALLGIIERGTERLSVKAEAHRERARVMAALAPDILAFDGSPDGERLRRFELASGRGLSRALDDLRKYRRDAKTVSGPLSAVSDKVEAIEQTNARSDGSDTCENTTNEATEGRQTRRTKPPMIGKMRRTKPPVI
jgi:hypothetical protein